MIHHRIAIVVSSVWGTGASTNPAIRAGHPHEGSLAQVEPDGTGWQANPTARGRTVGARGRTTLDERGLRLARRVVPLLPFQRPCPVLWGRIGLCRPSRFVYASF